MSTMHNFAGPRTNWPAEFPRGRPFDGVGADALIQLLAIKRWEAKLGARESRAITSLCAETDYAICVVARGTIEIVACGTTPKSRFSMVRLDSGDFLKLGRFPYLDREAAIRAVGQAELLGFHEPDFLDLVSKVPILARWALNWANAGRIREVVRTRDAILLDVTSAVLADLRSIGVRRNDASDGRWLSARTTQQEIADRIGHARESVSRACNTLMKSGLLERRKQGVYYVSAA